MLGLLLLYPALIGDMAERVAALDLSEGALDTLRDQIISVGVGSNNLDVQSMAAQLTQMATSHPTDQAAAMEAEFHAARASAEAVLGGISSEGHDRLTVAQNAVVGLVEALERDTVRADIGNQVKGLDSAPETYDRVIASMESESPY